MGAAESRQDLLSDSESDEEQQHSESEDENYEDVKDHQSSKNQTLKNPIKLYVHTGGNTANSKWVVAEKLCSCSFLKTTMNSQEEDDEDDEVEGDGEGNVYWFLKVGVKVRALVDQQLKLKPSTDQLRVDFVSNGVYAMKFFSIEDYKGFIEQYEKCLFENTYGFECNEENKAKVSLGRFRGVGESGSS